ncbi:O-antigen ligase family protein [Vibrio sp. E150_011]
MTTSTSWLLRTNIFLLIGLSISIPASKAGMNAFLYLYIISSFFVLKLKDVRLPKKYLSLIQYSIIIFGLGGALSLLSKGDANNLLIYIQKYAYLLMPSAIIISIHQFPRALKWSAVAFLSSCAFCLMIDLYKFAFVFDFFREGPTRIWGQIGYSRWPVALVTAITLACLIELNLKSLKYRYLAYVFIVISLFGLALTGTKGGIVAVAIVGMSYIGIKSRKHRFILPLAIIGAVLAFNLPVIQKSIGERFSLKELKTANSTTERVTMLKTGVAITKFNSDNDLNYLLWGAGLDKPEVPYQQALDSLDSPTRATLLLKNEYWGYTDLHNSYFDQLLKNGVIFSVLFYVLLTMMLYHGYKSMRQQKLIRHLPVMYAGTIIAYLVYNMFYSNFSDYAIYSQIYFIALALALPLVTDTKKVQDDISSEAKLES